MKYGITELLIMHNFIHSELCLKQGVFVEHWFPQGQQISTIIINKRPEGPLLLTLVPYNKRVKNLTSEWNQKQEQFIQNALYKDHCYAFRLLL